MWQIKGIALHDQLANLDKHAQLTCCFSAVAELLVYACFILICFVVALVQSVFLTNKDVHAYIHQVW